MNMKINVQNNDSTVENERSVVECQTGARRSGNGTYRFRAGHAGTVDSGADTQVHSDAFVQGYGEGFGEAGCGGQEAGCYLKGAEEGALIVVAPALG